MKKLALALVAATAITTAADANCSFSGFYIGAHTGYDNANAKFEGHYLTGHATGTAGSQINSVEAGKGHANFGAYVGYNFMSGCALFGAEMGYTFTKLDMDIKQGTMATDLFKGELKRKGYFTFAARMGYLLSPSTVAYVRLGANYGKWDASAKWHLNNNATTHYAKGHKHRLTFAPGIGLETALNRNVLLRAEWTYEFGSKSKALEPKTSAGVSIFERYNFKSVHANSFKVGIAYKF